MSDGIPMAGNHDCEYESEHEDAICKHCGLTSGEAIAYFEKLSEQTRRDADSVPSGGNQGAPLLTKNSVVCGEKPWTVEDVMRMLDEAAILKQYPWVRITDARNADIARLTARIRELEEEIKTMEIER